MGKVDQLQIELSHFDVIALTEIWLSENVSTDEIMFHNYQVPFRKDRITNSYGGVIVYVKDNIPCKRRLDLEIDGVECIWLELTLRNKTVLFSVFYRPPNSPAQTLVDIENTIDLAFDTNIGNIIVTGDFNLNWLDSGSKRKISSVFGQYNLAQLIREPTHFTENSSSLIDLIFTKNEPFVIFSGVGEAFLDQNLRYHCPVFAVFSFDKCKQPCFRRRIWKYDEADYVRLNHLNTDFYWSTIKSEDINTYAESFTDTLMEFCSLAIPNKMATIRPSAPPWLNSHVRRAIRKRKRAHKLAKRSNNEEFWRKYRVLRNESIKLLRKAKHDFKSNLAGKLTTRNMSSKDWWKNFKACVGKDSRENIPPLKNNYGQTINKPKEKADLFNRYFHSQTLLDDRDKDVPVLSVPNNTVDSIRLEVEEVQNILKSLQVGKASGPDFINNRILKEIAVSISTALTELFNTSLLLAQVPDIWKRANVSPIHKKDEKTDVVNYS